jgi:hypothetical protein
MSLLLDPIDKGILNFERASMAAQGTRGESSLVNIIESHLSRVQLAQRLGMEASVGVTK